MFKLIAKADDRARAFMARIFAAMTVAFWGLMDEAAQAADAAGGKTIGGRALALKNDLQNVYDLMLIIAMLAGVVLAIMGIVKMTKSSREEGGLAKAILFIAAGALLISVPALILYTSGSLMGQTEEDLWK